MTAMNYKLMHAVSYKSLHLWDVKRYFAKQIKSNFEIIKLKNAITFENHVIKPKEHQNEDFRILGVNNKDGLFDAYIEKGSCIKQVYQKVENNWIAYNPYRINVGSVGLKTDKQENEWISNAYVVFSCNKNLVPEFTYKILTSEPFNTQIKNFTAGSVRQNLTFDILSNLEIPLPDTATQNQLVNQYNQKLTQAQEAENQANGLEKSIESYLLNELGIEKPKTVEKKQGLQFARLKDINSWSIDKILYDSINDFNNFQNLSNPNYVINAFRGKNPKYEDGGKAIILNQKCNRWNEIKLDFAKTVNKNWFDSIDTKFKTIENDVLINSTGDGTIGRSSIVTKNFENLIYDSHILLLRLNQEVINPTFFVYQFNSLFVQSQIEQIKSAQSTKQTELGLDNLFKLNFVFPKIEIQEKIVNQITTQKEKIKALRQQAEALRKQAKENFEKEIFVTT